MTRLRSDRLVTGGLIILVGVLLLLSTTDYVATESLWDFLPAVFVALGVWALVRSRFRNLIGPVMVVAVAGAYQARNLGYVTNQQIGTWWPLFVVLFGVLYLVNRERRTRGVSVSETDAGEVSLVSLFSGTQRRVTGSGFRGGEVVAVFGGGELDLRDAEVSDPAASVECLVAFGGAEIQVPEDWTVDLDVPSLFGGSEDKRPPSGVDGDVDLVVTGLALFGGVSVER
ncbi:MAG: LiaI-LiaF-like domain-containing protein [Halobacterium sp.]